MQQKKKETIESNKALLQSTAATSGVTATIDVTAATPVAAVRSRVIRDTATTVVKAALSSTFHSKEEAQAAIQRAGEKLMEIGGRRTAASENIANSLIVDSLREVLDQTKGRGTLSMNQKVTKETVLAIVVAGSARKKDYKNQYIKAGQHWMVVDDYRCVDEDERMFEVNKTKMVCIVKPGDDIFINATVSVSSTSASSSSSSSKELFKINSESHDNLQSMYQSSLTQGGGSNDSSSSSSKKSKSKKKK